MATPNLKSMTGLLGRLGVRRPTKDSDVRNDLVKLSAQLDVTRAILKENSKALKEVAETDKDVAKLLDTLSDKNLKDAQSKIVAGEKVSKQEASALLDNLDVISKGILKLNNQENDQVKDLTDNLEVPLSAILEELSKIVVNENVDSDIRRDTLAKIQSLIDKQDIDTRVSKDLLQIDTANLKFSQEQTKNLDVLLSNMARSTTDIKMEGTLDRIDKNLEDLAFSNDELSRALDKNEGRGSLRDLAAKGLDKKDQALGLLDVIGPLVGIPNLGSLLGDVGGLAGGAFSLIGGAAIAKKAGGLFSKAGAGALDAASMAGGVAGKAGKAGKAGVGKIGTAMANASKSFTSILSKVGPALLKVGKMALKLAGPLGLVASAAFMLKGALEPFADLLFDKFSHLFGKKTDPNKNEDVKILLSSVARAVKGKQLTAGESIDMASSIQSRIDSGTSTLREELIARAISSNPDTSIAAAEKAVDKILAKANKKGSGLNTVLARAKDAEKRLSEIDALAAEIKAEEMSLGNLAKASARNVVSEATFGLVDKATPVDSEAKAKRISSIQNFLKTGGITASDTNAIEALQKQGAISSPTGTGTINITSPFGPRNPPKLSGGRFGSDMHKGVDIAAPEGSPISSVIAGTVSFNKREKAGASWVSVKGKDASGEQIEIRHHHAKLMGATSGSRVNQGDVVGMVATEGAYGPHQHLEVLRGGKHIDPVPFLRASGASVVGNTSAVAKGKSILASLGVSPAAPVSTPVASAPTQTAQAMSTPAPTPQSLSQKIFGMAESIPTIDKLFGGSFDVSKEFSTDKGIASFASDIKKLVAAQASMVTSLNSQMNSKKTGNVAIPKKANDTDISLAIQNSGMGV